MYFAELIGALIIVGLISRLVGRLFRRREYPVRGLVPNAITLAVVVPLAAIGNADGGPLAWGHAAAVYIPAVALWLAYDLARQRPKVAA